MARRLIQALTSQQRQRYTQLHAQYISNALITDGHVEWHGINGSGGTTGSGSGIEFLNFHRQFIRELEFFLLGQGAADLVPIAKWDPATPIPTELPHGNRSSNNPNVPQPSWTTVAGGSVPDPLFGHTNLLQFASGDEIGRSIGRGYHGAVHNGVGGTMRGLHSPEDPIFFPWHAFVDDVWAEWLKFNAGVKRTMTWHELDSSVGAVSTIQAEQVNQRHQVWFRLSGDPVWLYYYVDDKTAVGRVQSNSLRTSLTKQHDVDVQWEEVVISGTTYRKVYSVNARA